MNWPKKLVCTLRRWRLSGRDRGQAPLERGVQRLCRIPNDLWEQNVQQVIVVRIDRYPEDMRANLWARSFPPSSRTCLRVLRRLRTGPIPAGSCLFQRHSSLPACPLGECFSHLLSCVPGAGSTSACCLDLCPAAGRGHGTTIPSRLVVVLGIEDIGKHGFDGRKRSPDLSFAKLCVGVKVGDSYEP